LRGIHSLWRFVENLQLDCLRTSPARFASAVPASPGIQAQRLEHFVQTRALAASGLLPEQLDPQRLRRVFLQLLGALIQLDIVG